MSQAWTACFPVHNARDFGAGVRRHWRGELPLGRAVAVNLLLVDALLAVAVLAWETAEPILPPAVGALSTMLAVLAGVALAGWQMMGLWRCAGVHVHTAAQPLWGRLTQFLVVLGFAQVAIVSLAGAVPLTENIGRALVSGPPSYSVQVTHHGRVLAIDGPFDYGIAYRVLSALEAHPQVRRVRIDSRGGLTAEARRVRDLILERHLSTFSVRGCYSACTIAFMGGRQRLLASGARIGFHAYSAPLATRLHLLWEYARDRRFFRARGIPARFIDHAFATPARDIWTPSTEQLLDAHVLTGRYTG